MECTRDPVRVVVGSNPVGRVNDRQVLPREAPARARPRRRRRRKRKRIPGCHACRSAVRAFWVDRPARGPFRSFYLSPRGPQRGVVCPEALSERAGCAIREVITPACPRVETSRALCGVHRARAVCERAGRVGRARTRGRRRERGTRSAHCVRSDLRFNSMSENKT